MTKKTYQILHLIHQKRIQKISDLIKQIAISCNATLPKPEIYYAYEKYTEPFLIIYKNATSNTDIKSKIDIAFLQLNIRRAYDISDIEPIFNTDLLKLAYNKKPHEFIIFEIIMPNPKDTMNLISIGKSSEITKKLKYKSVSELIADAKQYNLKIVEQYVIDDYYLVTKGVCGVPIIIMPIAQTYKQPKKILSTLSNFNICTLKDPCEILNPVRTVLYAIHIKGIEQYSSIAEFISDFKKILE